MRSTSALCAAVVVLLAAPIQADEPSPTPRVELDARLKKIFSVSDCQYISGLTCKIHYNGKEPLPSEVYFRALDAKGKPFGKRTRLIYPHLKPGESGLGTFRLPADDPTRIRLEAVGSGPWKDPY
jgi:hypothetical protein